MQNNKTQQFAKFFIKDLKIKTDKLHSDKSEINELNTPSVN